MFLFSEKTVNANDVECVLCEFVMNELDKILQKNATVVSTNTCYTSTWVKFFRINPEFRILRLTFHRKSASKC